MHKSCGEWLRELGLLNLEKKEAQGRYNYLKGGCSKTEVGRFCQVTVIRLDYNSLMLHQGKFRLGIIKNFFSERVVMHWNRLPSEVMESLFLEMFKERVEEFLRDVV